MSLLHFSTFMRVPGFIDVVNVRFHEDAKSSLFDVLSRCNLAEQIIDDWSY